MSFYLDELALASVDYRKGIDGKQLRELEVKVAINC